MKKNYNLNSKSDMKRYLKDLKKQVYSTVEKEALSQEYEVECPSCHNKISVRSGKNYCPVCNEEINFSLNIK